MSRFRAFCQGSLRRALKFRCVRPALFAFLMFSAIHLPAQEPAGIFPTQKGTYWLYQGEATWENSDHARQLQWKTEILDSIDRPGFAAILLKGPPQDLAWYTPETKPQEALVVQIGSRFYFVTGEAVAPLFKSLRPVESASRAKDLVDDADIWFALPLKTGNKFCDPESPPRDDNMYCWYVEEEVPANLKAVKGAPQGALHEFRLAYRTNPDDESIGFVPGIGITSYDYTHHGTTAETHVRLVEFGRGGTDPQH